MYKVEFTPQAEEDLSCIDKTIAKRIVDKDRMVLSKYRTYYQ
ncbi:MAG: hypothetical protein AB1422_16510 [bacterium]